MKTSTWIATQNDPRDMRKLFRHRLAAWFDSRYLYQDTALTIPATEVGQVVKGMLDLSGAGKHATTSATSATVAENAQGRRYVAGLGTAGMVTPTIDLTGTPAVTMIVAARKASDTALGMIAEFGAGSAGGFYLAAPLGAAPAYLRWQSGPPSLAVSPTAAAYAAPLQGVFTGITDFRVASAQLRVNGAVVGTSTTTASSNKFGNLALNLGCRNGGTLNFDGDFYNLVLVSDVATELEIAQAQRYAAQFSGAVLT